MGILYILLGTAFGAIITYLRVKDQPHDTKELEKLKQRDDFLDSRIKSGEAQYKKLVEDLNATKNASVERVSELHKLEAEIASIKGLLEAPPKTDKKEPLVMVTPQEMPIVDDVDLLHQKINVLSKEKSELEKNIANIEASNLRKSARIESLEKELKESISAREALNELFSKEKEEHAALQQKVNDQKASFLALGKKFNSDFQNMGLKILEELESQQRKK